MKEEEKKALQYLEQLRTAVHNNDKEGIKADDQLSNDIDFTEVSQSIIDEIDQKFEQDQYHF